MIRFVITLQIRVDVAAIIRSITLLIWLIA